MVVLEALGQGGAQRQELWRARALGTERDGVPGQEAGQQELFGSSAVNYCANVSRSRKKSIDWVWQHEKGSDLVTFSLDRWE